MNVKHYKRWGDLNVCYSSVGFPERYLAVRKNNLKLEMAKDRCQVWILSPPKTGVKRTIVGEKEVIGGWPHTDGDHYEDMEDIFMVGTWNTLKGPCVKILTHLCSSYLNGPLGGRPWKRIHQLSDLWGTQFVPGSLLWHFASLLLWWEYLSSVMSLPMFLSCSRPA